MLTPPSLPIITCLRIGRVDPHRVVIDVNPFGAVGAERLATVIGDVERHAQRVDARVALRIDADLAEVHRPRVLAAQLPPVGAAIVAAIDAALGLVLDARVEDVGVLAVDVHADAALGAGRQAGLGLGPGLAAVGGLPDGAARPAAVHAPLRAAPLIGRGVERLAVRGIHHQLGRAGVVIDVQHALPVLPAVGGLVDAAFAAGRPQVAQRRHVARR